MTHHGLIPQMQSDQMVSFVVLHVYLTVFHLSITVCLVTGNGGQYTWISYYLSQYFAIFAVTFPLINDVVAAATS